MIGGGAQYVRSFHFYRLPAHGECFFFFLSLSLKSGSRLSRILSPCPWRWQLGVAFQTKGLVLGREDEPLNRISFHFYLIFGGNTSDCDNSLSQTSAEKSLVRSAAFKPVAPRSALSTETGHNSLDRIFCPLEKARNPDKKHKLDTFSGLSSICLFFLYFIDLKVSRFVSNGRIESN